MTLLITVFAAIICTVVWYSLAPKDEMKTGTLSLIFWGASLMWFADFIAEYAENKAACFTSAPLAVTAISETSLSFSRV